MSELLDEAISEAMAQIEAEPAVPNAPTEVVDEGEAEEPAEVTDEPEVTEEAPDGEPEEAEDEPVVEGDEEVDEEDDGQAEPTAFTLTDDATVVVDGEELTGKELREARLRHADYTRKTQELATQRQEVETLQQQMADWYNEHAAEPAAWITEIASDTDNPAVTIAQALEADRNPTQAVALILTTLAERGKLDADFVKQFGLESIAGKASDYESSTKLQRLERQVQEEREAREARERDQQNSARQQQLLADYERQWASIVHNEGLEFETPQARSEARLELMRFARDHEIPNLAHAHAAMSYGKPKAQPKQAVAKETVERKRKAAAVSPKSPPAGPTPRKRGDMDAAIREAAGDLGLSHLTQ